MNATSSFTVYYTDTLSITNTATNIHDQTINFLSDNNALHKYQSGFKKF